LPFIDTNPKGGARVPITTSEEKFVHELADMYDAERQFHYEMVSYADLIDGAEMMKKRRAVKLLTENRKQEVSTARKLERIAPRLGTSAA